MTPDVALQQIQEAMLLVMVLSMPPIIVASVVGILISLLQALTQIQEQTVSFAIKLIAVAATIAAMAGLLGSEMVNFSIKLFDGFPSMT
ncbi:type III secretion system export apparatus subunit SctS [Aureimonas jatrophae]|jgi:type III secretion protein S|uniref:Type III secretion protein S n=1 Tax=Aureimonas jatrophae TaxID=1166073 RepID=A0A1H0EU02_9HYPH|nr:type III secretion system export apparatus subunit SctS [Aureimonas jatrophae]MBB3950316.1 type III secretion protein S [Aureimonas jatrophae]SDN85805.1 type III secretion protein S [Aureimonas jatrophae]